MNDKKIAAFFDIDGTLYRDSLMTEHFKKLIKYEAVDERYWINGVKETYINWDKRFEDYDNYLFDVSKAYVDAITGLDKKYIDFATEQVIKLKADRVYKYTRSVIEKHKKEGHLIIFISGSPDFLVEAMGKKHHAFLAIGSTYIMKNNKFTGEVIPMWDSDSKNKMINELVNKYNIDLDQSFAYGDTNGDYNMLRRVGNPVAMNPSHELLNKIKDNEELSKKVTILIERKDVIYKSKADIEILEV
ncbi:HAD-superfamily subfamily IB hydrolase [Gemella morbillorum M424]|uniref:phosphoserine phosphatase n=1 Tax=Gemella morbillorum TaxID=29391 RepID=A0AAP9KSY2_9BACL|nr:HAD family hydrolase [Gemella morbillorum]EFV35353.1 HAD-superfamily subfamily IB hydrolase [Gemella morbillorum M424]QGS08878.1 HAD-IB family hydrolase [Gemella morbillorum]